MLLTEFVKGKLPIEDKQMHICEFVLSISYEKFDKLEGRLRLAAYDRMDRDMSSAESYDIIMTSCLLFLRTICSPMPHLVQVATQVQMLSVMNLQAYGG